ncbi:hypothetical protein WME75_16670 [Sorangium sp. So ce1014]|uniref:hypothetical protein n=1 Tax=Sorangium sp. So ce1014 TaxID=3133326 RepID=UPI003F5ED6C5
MKSVQRGSALRGLLTMVAAMGGRLESRIRLQKSAYLLKSVGVDDFRATPFKYHHYGPYSRALSDTLQEAIASNLLREDRAEYGDEQSKYTYALTEPGRAWIEENTDGSDPRVQQLAPLFKDAFWRVLELAATVLFVERDEAIHERTRAMERAVALKPACAEHRAAAESLLKSINL